MAMQEIFFSLIELAITNVPGGLGRRLRRMYYGCRLAEMGSGVVIDCGVRITNPGYVRIGSNTWIDNYVLIIAGPVKRNNSVYTRKGTDIDQVEGEVWIGSNCHIAPFVVLQGHGGIRIGSGVTVASGAKLYSLSHHYRNIGDPEDTRRFKFSSMVPQEEQALISAAVIVGEAAAVGLNSVLLPGSIVGNEAWIAAGSVIRGSVASRTVWPMRKPRQDSEIHGGQRDSDL